ncbi:MAG: glycosyltransferase family 8 protein [Lachnospiraceae bacterium]|nr:glycosyltransferase family 8 protein [Lachnospiraceae bacterium]
MYVIYHSSDAFASVTGVSMVSLFENNREIDEIHVLCIERGMSEENKEILKGIADQYGRTLKFMVMPDWSEKLNINIRSSKKGWLGFGFNRLFITEYLPEEIDRVLYLDSDTIIEKSLKEFWEQDLEGYYLAGVDDCLSSNYRKIVELPENGVYVNSGVLLINVKKWREEDVCRKCIKLLVEKNGFFVFNEQSIINSLFAGEIKIIPQNYNVNSLVFLYKYEELLKLRRPYQYSYTKEELEDAKTNPVITHYTGNFFVRRRPWVENSDHPHLKAFLYYREKSPWKSVPLAKDSRKAGTRFWTELCHVLPRSFMIILVSFLYNDSRPLFLQRKLKKNRVK